MNSIITALLGAYAAKLFYTHEMTFNRERDLRALRDNTRCAHCSRKIELPESELRVMNYCMDCR
jgi:hypothetical protein